MLGITDLKVGKTIVLDSDPWQVMWNQHSKSARGAGVMRTKLKNLVSGAVVDRTFQGAEKFEGADMRYGKAQFLYAAGDQFDFMDQETFETHSFERSVLGDTAHFLVEGMDVDLQFFNDAPINVKMPPKMTFEVTQTDPGVTGDRAQAGTKPATLETGYIAQVPQFIKVGDKVVINTDSGDYMERAKS